MPSPKKRQTRLTFEPTRSSSPTQGPSPARVRFTESCHIPAMRSSAKPPSRLSMSQRKFSDTMSSSTPVRSSQVRSSASFMPNIPGPRRVVIDDSSSESAAEDGELEDACDEDVTPHNPRTMTVAAPRSPQSTSTRLQKIVISDDEDEDEDEDESDEDDDDLPPLSSLPHRANIRKVVDDDGEDDDVPLPLSSTRRRRPPVINLDSDDEDEDISPPKRRKISQQTKSSSQASNSSETKVKDFAAKKSGRLVRGTQASSPTKRKGHRSEREKKMELLRRRRNGEKIDKLTSSESSDSDPHGLYDSDDGEFQVLKVFDDDEESQREEKPHHEPKKKAKKAAGKEPQPNSDGDDEDLDDFVVEDDDEPLGVPVVLIPLEFTAQAHKPLKEQFPLVIEWLVHNKINPAFDRRAGVYLNAWRKLDDEVRGLAQSKFTSSAWKADFNRVLRARPLIDTYELDMVDTDRYETCQACGRSGHPSTWRIQFQGRPYDKSTLDEIESESEGGEDDGDDSDGNATIDSQGNELPPTSKRWVVGSVCCSNAETAHSLIHWKWSLKSWAEEKLEDAGWFTARKLKEREKMKAKHRRQLAENIVKEWKEEGIVAGLYADFKQNLENARQKSTTGSRSGRWR